MGIKSKNDKVKEESQSGDEEDSKTDVSNSRSLRKRKPVNLAEVEAKIKAEEEVKESKENEPSSKTEEDKLEEYASLAATFQPTGKQFLQFSEYIHLHLNF